MTNEAAENWVARQAALELEYLERINLPRVDIENFRGCYPTVQGMAVTVAPGHTDPDNPYSAPIEAVNRSHEVLIARPNFLRCERDNDTTPRQPETLRTYYFELVEEVSG